MICRVILANDGRIIGIACGATEKAVRNVNLPDGIEHIEDGPFPADLGRYKAVMQGGNPVLDEHGKLQLILDPDREIDDEIERAKEAALLELIKPRLSDKARARLEGQL